MCMGEVFGFFAPRSDFLKECNKLLLCLVILTVVFGTKTKSAQAGPGQSKAVLCFSVRQLHCRLH